MRIFSGTLVRTTPGGVRIYEEPRIVEAAGDFLKQPGSALRIALEKEIDAPDQNPNAHPLVKGVRRLQEQGQLRGSLEIRRVHDKTTASLRERKVLHHMTLLDERGWRLETDPNPMEVKAIVNAGNADEARSLCRAFRRRRLATRRYLGLSSSVKRPSPRRVALGRHKPPTSGCHFGLDTKRAWRL